MGAVTLEEAVRLNRMLTEQTGGAFGVRDRGGLESAVAQPDMTYDQMDLYPTPIEKAAALGFSLMLNHPFLDGNKRTAHAVMELFLLRNGLEIDARVGEQERVMLCLAAGELERAELTSWLQEHIRKKI